MFGEFRPTRMDGTRQDCQRDEGGVVTLGAMLFFSGDFWVDLVVFLGGGNSNIFNLSPRKLGK